MTSDPDDVHTSTCDGGPFHPGPCDAASPQPDTAPEGPWTVNGNWPNSITRDDGAEVCCYAEPGTSDADDDALARRVAAALNGAPATPAERAVIDAAEEAEPLIARLRRQEWRTVHIGTAYRRTELTLSPDTHENWSAALAALDAAVADLRSERNKT